MYKKYKNLQHTCVQMVFCYIFVVVNLFKCSFSFQHFVDGKPTDANPYPVPANPHDEGVKGRKGRKRPATTPLQKYPSKKQCITSTNTSHDATEKDVAEALVDMSVSSSPSRVLTSEPLSPSSQPSSSATQTSPVKTPLKTKLRRHISNREKPVSECGICTKDTSGPVTCPYCKASFTPSPAEMRKISRMNFMAEVQKDDETCFRYTGIPTVGMLRDIYAWVQPTASKMKIWDGSLTVGKGRTRKAMTLFDEFVLTLVRIRRGYDTNHLAYLFATSQRTVSRIFLAWVNFFAKSF